MRDYLSTINGLDRNIGRMLDYLKQNDLEKNTVVIYMSDQGFYMGEHGWFDKRWMYEESFRTPLIVKYPGKVKPGTKINGMVLNLDVAPTLLDIAKAPIPRQMQGKSFLPLMKGATDDGYNVLYYHYYEDAFGLTPHFGIKTDRYKLIRFYKGINQWELYDLKKDPHEMNNLDGKKKYKKITHSLKKELKRQIEKFEDDGAAKVFDQLL